MREKRRTYEKILVKMGPSKAMSLFLSKYGNDNTKCGYVVELSAYFRWLRESQGVTMTPDELVLDNLKAIYESKAVDVAAKRRHTDWLNGYTNGYLLEQGFSESKRHIATNAIRQFYEKNDSSLFGDYSLASQPLAEPAPPLYPDDVRKVLLALPVRARAPLVLAWQSGIEINRLLALDLEPGGSVPMKIPLFGRKGHKKAYWSYAGRDSVQLLKTMGARGFQTYDGLKGQFRGAAVRLGGQGMLKNPDPRSWHIHALRHSFSTECKAAGVDNETREFFLGHTSGINHLYQHGEIVHEEKILAEYEKVEPHVSLDYTEATMRDEFDEERRSWLEEIASLRREMRQARESSK